MEPLKTLSAGAFVAMTFQIETSFATAGIHATLGTTGPAVGGLIPGTTTATTGTLGLTINAQTAVNTAALVTLIVNPDLVLRAKLSGGATSDTSLAAFTENGTASTTLNMVSTASPSAPNSPDLDDGSIWAYSGSVAQDGLARNVSVAGATTFTILNAWPTAPVDGDEFIAICPPGPGGAVGFVTLTGTFDQIDGVDDAGAGWQVLAGEYNGIGNDGLTNSFLHLMNDNHVL